MPDRKPRVHAAGSPEGRLGAALAAGDEGGIRAARAALVASVEGWCNLHARRWWSWAGMRGSLDDYRQAAVVAAWKAAQTFDPARGTKFTTYVTMPLRQQLATVANHEAAGGQRVPRYEGIRHIPAMHLSAIHTPEAERGDFSATLPAPAAPEAPPDPGEVWDRVRRALADHPRAERLYDVVYLRYGQQWGLAEIGERHGVTKEAVRQWLRAALDVLRERRAGFEGVR